MNKEERPKNFVVTTVTGKEVTLSESDTQQLYDFIDMDMSNDFINTWLFETVSMYNADDRYTPIEKNNEAFDEELEESRESKYMLYTIFGILALTLFAAILNFFNL